jgi:hypothetical protein
VGGPLSEFQITAAGHGLVTGDVVVISGVAGTEANFINGNWFVTVIDANTFTLDNSQFFGGDIDVTAPPTVTQVTECHDPVTLETVPHFEFRFYLHAFGANPNPITDIPPGNGTLTPYTGSAVAPPPAELPGVTATPFSICEMTAGAGADGWNLTGVTIDIWNFGTPITDPPDVDDQPMDLFSVNDGSESGVCFNGFIPAGTQRWEISASNSKAGGTRTIGYWSNWNSCDGRGNQVNTAAKNGGPAEGFWLLDDVLEFLNIPNVTPPDMTCAEAVDLLNKSSIADENEVRDGEKRANDAAYGMVAQLIAAEANYAAGALQCGNTTQAINQAITLLGEINFTGNGSYLPPKDGPFSPAVRSYALALAGLLDTYNNLHDIGDCGTVPAPPTVVTP